MYVELVIWFKDYMKKKKARISVKDDNRKNLE